ncbi:MAG: aldose epimerase family protein [Pseudomonadota bacterium]
MASSLIPGVYPFGTRPDGQAVKRVVLANETLGVAILTQGAIIQDVRMAGVFHSLTIGTDTLEPYLGDMRSCGSLIGPVINRISNGSAHIGRYSYEFERNQDGKHTRHSGTAGTQRKLWEIDAVTDTALNLSLTLPDGEGGFPGNRQISAQFTLREPAELEMRVTSTTDKPTILNFANHSYWNLDGTNTYAGHRLQVAADRRCIADDGAMVTGEVAPVEGTFFDFREAVTLTPGEDPLIDVNMCVSTTRRNLTDVLRLEGTTGVSLQVATTEPGVQLYDGSGFKNAGAEGHDGRANAAYCGIAIEAQGWPDAINHAHFPSILVEPGHIYQQVTRFRFAR